MTQKELAEKWSLVWAESEDPRFSVEDAIFKALQEQEKIHPWADAEERYKRVLDDFQALANSWQLWKDYGRAKRAEFDAALLRAQKAEHELAELRDDLRQQAIERDL